MTNGIAYLGSAWFTTQQAKELAALVGSGKVDLSSYEHTGYPLDQVNEALDASTVREKGGFTNVFVEI